MLEEVLPNGEIKWKRFDSHGFEDVGHFLACHLVVEHYLECHLKTKSRDLDWESGKLNFAQKVSLLNKENFPDDYNFLPLLKHLNSIRNKLSHSLNYKISVVDVQPFKNFISTLRKKHNNKKSTQLKIDPEEGLLTPQEVVNEFTMLVCSFLAGSLTVYWQHYKKA